MSDLPDKPLEFWLNFELHEPEVWDEPHELRYPNASKPEDIIHVIEYEVYADLVKMHDWYRTEMLRHKEAFQKERYKVETLECKMLEIKAAAKEALEIKSPEEALTETEDKT